jgi:threonine dehydrogenase-like Zn-dependent dehydrogenase
VGEVEEGPAEWKGKRVVAGINFACRECEWCARGHDRHCPTRTVMGILGADGAFAERMKVPVANLHEVPESISDETAVFAEPLAAAYRINSQVELEPDAEVIVLGDGKLGLLCAQVQHASGRRVTLVGKHESKLKLAADAGMQTVLLGDFKPRTVDMVVEATGSEKGLEMAMSCTRPMGSLVLKSTVAAEHKVSLAPIVINELTVVGSRCGTFPPALAALSELRIDVAPMISDVFSLDEGVAAVEKASSKGTLKVLLRA